MRILKIETLPGIKRGWIDRDIIMLHACFQILVDWVEKENGLTDSNYEVYKETIGELKRLYDWWKSVDLDYLNDTIEVQRNLISLIQHRGFLWT